MQKPQRRHSSHSFSRTLKRHTSVGRGLRNTWRALKRRLERAGLIGREKQGREVLISFRPEPLRLVSGWVHEYEKFWSERLDQFEGFFKEKRKKEP